MLQKIYRVPTTQIIKISTVKELTNFMWEYMNSKTSRATKEEITRGAQLQIMHIIHETWEEEDNKISMADLKDTFLRLMLDIKAQNYVENSIRRVTHLIYEIQNLPNVDTSTLIKDKFPNQDTVQMFRSWLEIPKPQKKQSRTPAEWRKDKSLPAFKKWYARKKIPLEERRAERKRQTEEAYKILVERGIIK